jgi:oligopeptide/dipeptide ABC transporter ATP-binding protein
MSPKPESLLVLRDLKKHFPIKAGLFSRTRDHLKAVDGVSFSVRKGETFGIVGESGCGKTTLGRVILRLLEPTGGEAWFKGIDLFRSPLREFRALRRDMQIIFQDPFASINPRLKVGSVIGEPLLVNGVRRARRRERVAELIRDVGLDLYHLNKYPHEFSGGQRQRIGIARALALRPELVICDEPVSALDVSIQGQIINLLIELQKRHTLTYLFISHDLSLVQHISDRIGVMYLGRIVELAPVERIFAEPLHPYTQALFSAIPSIRSAGSRIILKGDVPNPIQLPRGCRFQSRCWKRIGQCTVQEPPLQDIGEGHFVSCHLACQEAPHAQKG